MDKTFLRLLVCPQCQSQIKESHEAMLFCVKCKQTYPVRKGIPIMVNLNYLPPHLRGQVSYFTKETQQYGKDHKLQPWQEKYFTFLSFLQRSRNTLIIDNACGSGYIAIESAKRGFTVVASDLNFSALVRLKKISKRLGLEKKIFVVCCSAEAMPIRSNSADAVVANAILEHLPQEYKAIEHIKRIVKKKGVVFIVVPIAYIFLNPLLLPLNMMHDRRIGHLRRYTKNMLKKRFQGWVLKKIYYSGYTAKVIKTFINMVFHIYDEQAIEREDEKNNKTPLFSTNVNVLFMKK
jgi:ubiquinone/menaquinone biosynthesis C-methylase UbiE/uncharacterized protein YbaR (Trm112 family)